MPSKTKKVEQRKKKITNKNKNKNTSSCGSHDFNSSLFKPMTSSLLIQNISTLIKQVCDVNDTKPQHLTPFHSSEKPKMSVVDYIHRAHRYLNCSETCFVLALVYMDRVQRASNISIDSLSAHRLFTTSLLLAIKFLEDTVCSVKTNAKVGGLSVEELIKLELCMYQILGQNLYTPTELFEQCQAVLSHPLP